MPMFSMDYSILVLVTIVSNVLFLIIAISDIRVTYQQIFAKEKKNFKSSLWFEFLLFAVALWSAGDLLLNEVTPARFEYFLLISGINSALFILLLALERALIKTRY